MQGLRLKREEVPGEWGGSPITADGGAELPMGPSRERPDRLTYVKGLSQNDHEKSP